MRKMISLLMAVIMLNAAFPLSNGLGELYDTGESEAQTYGREIIVTGDRIWQAADGDLLCKDLSTGNVMDSFSLENGDTGPLADGELFRFNLLTGEEGELRLCGALTDAEGEISVWMMAFELEGERIGMRSTEELTDLLGEFYGADSGILQVDMVPYGGGIFLTAMDEDFSCHLFWASPGDGEIYEVGELPYAMLTAVIPYGEEQLMLAGDSLETAGNLSLMALNVFEGEMAELAEIPAGNTISAQNFAYDAEAEQLYFTLRNAVYRVAPEDGQKPEAIAVFSAEPAPYGKGAIAGGQYIVQTEEGELLRCDLRAEMDAVSLRILNCTENLAIEEISARFNAAQDKCFLTMGRMDEELDAEERMRLLREADGIFLSLSSPEYREIIREGIYEDLSAAPGLREAASEFEAPLRNALTSEGTLAAFPAAIETPCLTVNLAAMETLTGMKAEEIPREWGGFLEMISGMAESGCFEAHPEYAIITPEFTQEEFREVLLIYLIRSVLLDASTDPERKAMDSVPALLEAFSRIDWGRLGLEKEESLAEGDKIPVIGEEFFEITTAYQDPDAAFWPLATAAGRERIIPQQIIVLILNRNSGQTENLKAWAEYLWEQSEVSFRMCLCPGMNETVKNGEYESTIAELEEMLRTYEEWIQEYPEAEETEAIRQSAEDLRQYLEAYRTEAQWLVSEESLEAYRREHFAPDPCAFWETEEGAEMLEEWLAEKITTEELTAWILSMI